MHVIKKPFLPEPRVPTSFYVTRTGPLTVKLACQSKLALTPTSDMTALITSYMILELAPVPCFFPMKETVQAPRRRVTEISYHIR